MLASMSAFTRRGLCLFALAAFGASGCFLDREPFEGQLDPERGDAAPPRDAGGQGDAGAGSDAGPKDAGSPDAGPPDAGPPDAGPPIIPLPVTSGLLVHFDAQRVAGDGVPVPSSSPTTWVDLTSGNDATCNNVRLLADGIGPGRPAMRTNGSSLSKCVFPIPDIGDLTIAVVLRTNDARSAATWWESPVIVGGDMKGWHRDAALFASGGLVGFARRDTTMNTTLAIADDTPHLVSLVRVRESGETTIRVDDGVHTAIVDSRGEITAPDTWWLASHGIEGFGGFDARYGEVLIYTRALSPSELDSVDAYLRARWQL